jgi:hypothetical protein
MAQDLLEPRVGGEALLVNCMLYEPTCLKAPATTLVSPPAPAATADSGESPDDPVTTSSTVSIPWRSTLAPNALGGGGEAAAANSVVRVRGEAPGATGSARPRHGVVLRVKG